MAGFFRRAASAAAALRRRVLGRGGAAPAPVLRELVRGNYYGFSPGQWQRAIKADWLGPYTPTRVPFWILKLMRDDPQLALGLLAFKSPFFGIEYRVEGGSPATRRFVEKTFHERPVFWRVLSSILNAIDFGFQSHELLWELEDVTLESGPGFDGGFLPLAYVLRDVFDIDPERMAEIIVDEHGRLHAINVDGLTRVPAEKLLHVVHDMEWRNHYGRSTLKRAYQPWYWCNWLYAYLVRYMEGRADPPIIGTAPNEYRYNPDVPKDQQVPTYCPDELNSQIVRLRSGSACTLPFETDEKGNAKWKLEVLEDGGRVDQFLPAIEHLQALKLRALLMPEHVATQDNAVGSYASSRVKLDVFFSNMEVVKRVLVLGSLNEGVVRPIVEANFGKRAPMPKFTASDLSRDSKELLAQIVMKALDVPLVMPDGKQFQGAQLIDLERSLGALNVPRVAREAIAAQQKTPVPTEPAK
jgi:hypothetical protein